MQTLEEYEGSGQQKQTVLHALSKQHLQLQLQETKLDSVDSLSEPAGHGISYILRETESILH